MFAAVLNRPGSLGPQTGKRSRGELPLLALERRTAAGAAEEIGSLDAAAYRTFNMVIGDANGAWFVRGSGSGRPRVIGLDGGVHIVTAHDPNDPNSARARAQLPRFQAAPPPNPDREDWSGWAGLLGDRTGPRGAAINVPIEGGFGTVCSSLAGVSADGRVRWLFAAGPPDRTPFAPVTLP